MEQEAPVGLDRKTAAFEEIKARRKAESLTEPKSLPLPQDKPAPTPKEIEFSKLPENYVKNVWDMVSGIAEFAFVGLPKRLYEIGADPSQYARDLKLLFGKEGLATLKVVWESGPGRYFKGDFHDAMQEIVTRPADFLLDLSFLFGISAKSATLAGTLSKARNVSEVGKLAALGEKLARVSRNLDPLMHVTKGISKVGKPALEAFGVGEHTKALLRLKNHEYSAESLEKVNSLKKALSGQLTTAEASTLDRAISVGAPDDIARLSPAAKVAYEAWLDIVGVQEKALVGREFISESRAFVANAKRAAAYLFPDGPTRKNVRVAAQMMKDKKISPTFASMYRVGSETRDLFNTLTQDIKSIGKVGRLEARRGFGEFEKDPRKYMHRQINAYHEFNKRIRWMDRSIQYLKARGLVKSVKSGGDLPQGYAFLPHEIYKKYFENVNRAGSVVVSEMMKGATEEQAVLAAYQKLISDPSIAKGIAQAEHIAVPRHVAALIAREFKIPGPIGRVFDRAMGYWKAAATIFSPRYWISTALGNGFMATLFGLGPDDLWRARGLKESLPAPIRSRIQTDIIQSDVNLYERVSQNIGQYASGLDNALRQAAFVKHTLDERRRLMGTGANFFAFSQNAKDFVRSTAIAPERVSQIERTVQLLEEKVARSSREVIALNKELAKAEAKRLALLNSVDTRAVMAKMRARTALSEPEKAILRKVQEAGNDVVALEGRVKDVSGPIVENMIQMGKARGELPILKQYEAVADEAVDFGNAIAGSYGNLHPIERDWFRRAVPFYGFTKAMTLLSFRMPYMFPTRTFMWNNVATVFNDVFQDDETPTWVRRYFPIMAMQDGSILGINMMSANPFAGARTAQVGETTIPRMLDPREQQPLVKLYMDLSGATPSWSKRPLSPGDKGTRLSNGEAFRYDERTKAFVKTIPQGSPWRALWNLFPQSQLVETLFQDHVQTDRGWIGNPDPIRLPNGEPMFPIDLLQKLSAPFINMRAIDVEKERQKEHRRVYRVVKSFAHDIRRMPPEKREQAMEIIRQWRDDKISPSLGE